MESQLAKAVMKGERDTVRNILSEVFFDYPIHPTQQQTIDTQFCKASSLGHVGIVDEFLKFGAAYESLVCKALSFAAQSGHVNVVKLLLEHDAHVDFLHEYGKTAMMLASENGHAAVVDVLLNHGAQVDLRFEPQNCSALLYSCVSMRENAPVVQVLLQHHARVDIHCQTGETALVFAASRGFASVVDQLLKYDGQMEMMLLTTQCGLDALILASLHGHASVVELLLKFHEQQGLELVNLRDNVGWTALMHASKRNHASVIHILKRYHALVDLQDQVGTTALMIASMEGSVAAVKALVSYNANVYLRNQEGQTALMMVAELTSMYAALGARRNVADCQRVMDVFLKHDVSQVDHADENGHTFLMWACAKGLVHALEKALQCKPDTQLDVQDQEGRSPLILASMNGHIGVVDVLLTHQVQVDLQDHEGMTALHHAATNTHALILSQLLTHNAQVDLLDKDGRTAMMLAAQRGSESILDVFKDHVATLEGASDLR